MTCRAIVLLAAFVICSTRPLQVKAQTGSQTKTTDAFLQGKPFTYDQILDSVGTLAHRRITLAIESRKVDFAMTEAQAESLKKAGATEQILQTIRSNVATAHATTEPAPVPPPKPTPKTATLNAECQPAECAVFIDDKPLGFTSNGHLAFGQLVPRSFTLSFRKEGYLKEDMTVVAEPGSRITRTVKLLPDEKFASEQGQRLFSSMLEALGGEAGLQAASAVTCTGEVTIYPHDGQLSQWTAAIRYLAPDAVSFRLKGSGVELQSSIGGKGYRANKELGKHPLASEIDADLRFYRDYQLPTLINRIRKEKFQLTALDGRRGFVARNAADTYTFHLGANLLPESVHYASGTGLGSGIRVLYTNYSKESGIQAPRTIAIRLPDAPQHGMEVRLSTVVPAPKLSEKDFR